MPHTPDLHIVRAWRYATESDRVHFIVASHDGGRRHLYTPNTSALGRVLDAELNHLGYTMPKSAGDDESEGLPAES
jgi:hypothetical protein